MSSISNSDLESLDKKINEDEYLYRGIIDINWDFNNNRPSSAAFKDSKGVSVDRDARRKEKDCVDFLNSKKDFFAICKVQAKDIKQRNAIINYLPNENNIYHSEIHNSVDIIQMKGSKPKKIRDDSIVVYKS